MASSLHLFSLFFLISLSSSQTLSPPPKALVLPVSKHAFSLQYLTRIAQRTPLVPLTVAIDLSGPFLLIHSNSHSSSSSSSSSSYRHTPCHSNLCNLAHSSANSRAASFCPKIHSPCILFSQNDFTSRVSSAYLSRDVLSLHSTDGLSSLSPLSVSNFLFLSSSDRSLVGTLESAVSQGVAGLGHGLFGLPAQLSAAFGFSRKFAVCLAPSTNSDGVIFFGDGPYVLFPGIDVSKLLIFTPLILRKSSGSNREYNLGVKSIRVNGKQLRIDPSLSTVVTQISTIHPYSVLETSIYNSLARMFVREALAANFSRVEAVAPFDVCFGAKSGNGGSIGASFPVIDLMLQDEKVFWRIFQTNSMVTVGRGDVACLGFLDGGVNPEVSMVLGGYQLEDNLVQLDLGSASFRLGFTNSLLLRQTSCANFNFTHHHH